MGDMAHRAQIIVKGVVQGVGFRPYVFTLAETFGLKGYVTNAVNGVFIDVEGPRLGEFIDRLPRDAPPLSRISDVAVTTLPLHGYDSFTIRKSLNDGAIGPVTLLSPDVSICGDCLREFLDPGDRRFRYPFINCTNCGPRYSITTAIPYDRPNTTMASFTMCEECEREYHDPKNRRFHAQPNACPQCGPSVEFRVRSAECGVNGYEAITQCVRALQDGGIVAIKGLGGFHIACDAKNDAAVRKLRERKRRSNKPFAVMMPDAETVMRFCAVTEEERRQLESLRRPIALLRKSGEERGLSRRVAPQNRHLGCMLPYTPLHVLLFHQMTVNRSDPANHLEALVMTSGNLSEEPIVRDNREAVEKLSGIVDAFLLHNRDIFMRVDDSVIRVRSSEPSTRDIGERSRAAQAEGFGVRSEEAQDYSLDPALRAPHSTLTFIRRSRGYAPDPIPLSGDGPEIMACGADLKNTFTLTKGAFAIPSQHIGDMENYETLKLFEESLENLKAVYRVAPVAIAYDLHPGYLSTKWAKEQGKREEGGGRREEGIEAKASSLEPPTSIRLYGIQHHYAHIGSVMAEQGITEKIIGVAFDGTGHGTDGAIWGGEFIIADINGFERVARLNYIPLPGGEAAIREPWKTAISYIMESAGDNAYQRLEEIGFCKRHGEEAVRQVMQVARSRELSPLSSGAGRLFDAVSAILGICDTNTFEGEAAMALESYTDEGIEKEYQVEIRNEQGSAIIDFSSAVRQIVNDVAAGVDRKTIATGFHNTVARAIRAMVQLISDQYGIRVVAMSGGTFQNNYLTMRTMKLLKDDGLTVHVNQKVPCNDAGISLGQAYIVRERLKKSHTMRMVSNHERYDR